MKITGPRKNHCFAVLLLLAILNTKFCSSFQIKQDHCITCDSSKDENCRANVTSDMIARCPIQLLYDDQINTGCFHYEDTNDIVRRGCVSAAKQELRELCQSNSEVCKTCSNKDEKGSCNNIPGFQKCFDCNSRDNDNCAQINNSTKTTICKQYFSTCVTGIDKNGYTHRLCSDGFVDGNKREIPNGFEECLQTKCNGNIFPKERLMCHQCNNGSGYDDLPAEFLKTSTILSEPHACKTFSLYDQCYTYIGEDNKIYRGCNTDATSSRLLCDLNPEKCIKCTESGCNKQKTAGKSSSRTFTSNILLTSVLSLLIISC